jgi:hypothetical protein
MNPNQHYAPLARHAIEATEIPRLLRAHSAVALERVARGGGATRWYSIATESQLVELAAVLTPGSCLSMYFDERIRRRPMTEATVKEILGFIEEDGDALIGRLGEDGLTIDMTVVAGRAEIDEVTAAGAPSEPLYFGRFPARDDDARTAVTIELPDADDIVRRHPH